VGRFEHLRAIARRNARVGSRARYGAGTALEITHRMLRCTPFLLFDGNCAEAMTFYQRCLGGELRLTKLGDTPMKESLPLEKHGRIINAHLKSGDLEISATDWMASPELDPVRGNTTAIFVIGSSYAELKRVFDKLKDGTNNTHLQELHEMPFGTYGQFFDRYGVQWIFRSEDRKSPG
jgi:PhnB protein